MCANFGCLLSWRYCNDCSEVLSRTGISRLWRNLAGYCRWAAWDGVITLAMAAFCEGVRVAMGDLSVVLFPLGGGRSAVGNMDLVRHAISSNFLRWVVVVLLLGRREALECSPLEVSLGVGLHGEGT